MWGRLRKNRIAKLSDYLNSESGSTILIIGAGGTLREYEKQIKKFISDNNPVTIGVNCMTEYWIPDYHLWTNKQRYQDLGGCIDTKSKMMFGSGLPEKLIRKHFKGDYIVVDYVHKLRDASKDASVKYKDGKIYGYFRTAGCLAIVIAHLLGASKIYIVGMDGFTLHSREELIKQDKNHHCYGKGYTDDATWQECIEKDRLVYENLYAIYAFGAKFKILTPTKFERFYDPEILQKLGEQDG